MTIPEGRPRGEGVAVDGLHHVVALRDVDAELLEEVPRFVGLDTLSDDPQSEAVPEFDDGPDDDGIVGTDDHPLDEGHVDLDLVDREPSEV